MLHVVPRLLDLVRLVAVDDPPSGVFQRLSRRVRGHRIEPRPQKTRPIVGREFVERGDDIVKRVSLQRRLAARPAIKRTAEVVHRFLVVRQPPHRGVDVEPQQLALFVEIDSAPPILPIRIRIVENGSGVGRILQGRHSRPGLAPISVAMRAKSSRDSCIFHEPAARRQHLAKVFRKAFVDPQQIVLHGLVIIGRG